MGSAFSRMSADPRPPNGATSGEPDAPAGTDADVEAESTGQDVAALRAAVLKSALQKRRSDKSATDKEDGEISEGDGGPALPADQMTDTSSGRMTALPVPSKLAHPSSKSASGPNSPQDGIKRSTVVTISNHTGEVKRQTLPVSGGKEEETQCLEIIRNLLHDGVAPDTLIDNGTPPDYIRRVCEDIVAGSRTRKSLWNQARSPVREGLEAPSAAAGSPDGSPQAGSESPSPSSSIEVAVHSVRPGSESESENEAAVERMTAPPAPSRRPSIPRIIPTSSWTPSASQAPSSSGVVRIESYRPPTRPASTLVTPVSSPFTPTLHAMPPLPPIPLLPPPPPPPQQHKRQKRHRDYDSVNDSVNDNTMVLNYGDEESSASASASLPTPTSANVPLPPSPAVAIVSREESGLNPEAPSFVSSAKEGSSLSPIAPTFVPAPAQPAPPAADLAEVRRKALESMRQSMRKRKASAPLAAPQTETVPEEVAKLEREITGSAVEVPMDIDDEEPEEGEIEDSTGADSVASTPLASSAPTPPLIVTSTSLRRTGSARGVKRPLAEDLNDTSGRPKTVARVALNRRAFGAPQRSNRLVLCLDDDSDSDSSSDEDSSQSNVTVPRIVIPSPFPEPDTAALLAEKAESIRKLKEQIAARLLAKKSTQNTPATSVPGSPARAEDERRVEEAAAAAENVGVEGLASDVVQAAVLAAAEEQKQSDKAGSQRKGKAKAKGKGKGKAKVEVQPAEQPISNPDPGNASVLDTVPSGKSDSLQNLDAPNHSNFHAYRPLLPSYPQLAASSLDMLPKREKQKENISRDPAASICRSEASGGSCANPACDDVHILRSEPTDDDIVMYATRLVALQGSKISKSEDAANALKKAKAEVVAQMEDHSSADSRWANPENLTALVDLTAQRLRAR